jgi:hypothetical protein
VVGAPAAPCEGEVPELRGIGFGFRAQSHAVRGRTTAEARARADSLPSLMLLGAAQRRKRQRTDYASSANAASAVACSWTSAASARVIAVGSSCWMTLRP